MNKKPISELTPTTASSLPTVERTKITRRKQVEALMGNGRSTIYNRIHRGLMTKPVNLGGRIVGWPECEIVQLNAARISGWSDDQIRKLVTDLEAGRANVAPR